MLVSKSFLFLLPPVLIIISAYYYAGTKTLEDDKKCVKKSEDNEIISRWLFSLVIVFQFVNAITV